MLQLKRCRKSRVALYKNQIFIKKKSKHFMSKEPKQCRKQQLAKSLEK